MKISKKGFIGATTALLLVIALFAAVLAVPKIQEFVGAKGLAIAPGALPEIDTEAKKDIVASSCSGVQSVNALYDDKNAFKVGTDPSTNLQIYDPVKTSVADDATSTTVPTLGQYKGLAGYGNTADYFAREVQFTTECSDVPVQTQLFLAKTPTITVVQDDGITKFTSSAQEAVAVSSEYTASYTVKSPAEGCSSVYGAVFACEYDATGINKIESSDVADFDTGIYIVHTNTSFDQWKTFKWTDADNKLCDGDKAEFDISYTLTAAAAASEPHINCSWLGINKDLDADTFELITSVYDEDNNELFLVPNSGYIYANVAG